MTDLKRVESVDKDGKEVVVFIRNPNIKDHREAQLAYNKAFREALESGAIMKQKLKDFMKEQGIWDDVKESKHKKIFDEISAREKILKSGGVPLKRAKEIALEMRGLRADITELLSEKQSHESSCAEGQADNAKFNQLVVCCVVKENGQRVWANLEAYETQSDEPWAYMAASELAEKLYGLDPSYYNKLPENEFLVKYKFANKELRLVNKDGHLVDTEGRLINDEGRYVAYRDGGNGEKVQYFVNKEGEEIDENGDLIVEFAPFLDDDGNPVEEPEVTEEKTVEGNSEESQEPSTSTV